MNPNTINSEMPWWVGAIERLGLVTIMLVGGGLIIRENIPPLVQGHLKHLEESTEGMHKQTEILLKISGNDERQTVILGDMNANVEESVVVAKNNLQTSKDNQELIRQNQELIKQQQRN
jgi:predicted DNA repair protein MutK